jgi:methionyl-tRNA formyltransferase
MGICIYGLGKKAFIALQQLDPAHYTAIDLIVVGSDDHISEDYAQQLKDFATEKGLRFCGRKDPAVKTVTSLQHIAIGWRWLIPVQPQQQLFVLHDSLLPKYRGFNPLVTALINGDTVIGATCFIATTAFDEGAVIAQKKIAIQYPVKIDRAITLMGELYAGLLNDLFLLFQKEKNITAVAQDEAAATYSLWRDEEDYKIDWSQDAATIQRFVDATGFPYGGAFVYYQDKKIRIIEVEIADDVIIVNRTPGKILKKQHNNPVVVCGAGLIEIKQAMDETGQFFIIDALRVRL